MHALREETLLYALLAASLLLVSCTSESQPVSTAKTPPPSKEPTAILWQDGVENAYPRWSRDGSKILFQSNRTGAWQLFVMNKDGSGQQQLTTHASNNYFADWSPDNSKIAFVSDREGNENVFVMNMDGSGLLNLSRSASRNIHPYWAPDGQSLLFNSDRDDHQNCEIYKVNPDGTGLVRLTYTPLYEETCARFSPDGNLIVYLRGGGNDDICVMNKDGGNQVNVTRSAAAEGWPVWSPDGTKIIYASDVQGVFMLYVMNADGTNAKQLAAAPPSMKDARPQISADGRMVVFNRQSNSTIGIFTLRLME